MKALRKNPAERYASAAEMREDLKRVANGAQVAAPSAGVAAGAYADETSVMPAVERAERLNVAQAPQVRPVPQRRMPAWGWVLIAAAVLLVGLGVAWAAGAFGPGSVAVPTVTGMTEEEASATISAAGLKVGNVTTANSDEYELGTVMSQDPAAGGRVEKGYAINLVVSAGIAQVEVPNVVGMSEADAITTIEQAELQVGLPIQREFNTEVPEGTVISSEPSAAIQVPKGTKITIIVSKGTELLKVPDVVGKKKAVAEKTITDAGFKVKVTEEYNDTTPVGNVISQNPDGGVSIDAGSTVTIVVSKGANLVNVPDVTDMTEADAIAQLEDMGLVANVIYQVSPDVGIVINQDPLPDAKVAKGSTVKIYVGKAP